MQLNVRLSASALRAVNARLDELRELLAEADAEGEDAPFYSVTIALSLDPGSADARSTPESTGRTAPRHKHTRSHSDVG